MTATSSLEWAALRKPPDESSPRLTPFAEYTLEELCKLSKQTIVAEIRARRIKVAVKLSRDELAEALFFRLRKLKDHVEAIAAIAVEVARVAASRATDAAARAEVRPIDSPQTPSFHGSSRRIRDVCILTYVPSKSHTRHSSRP